MPPRNPRVASHLVRELLWGSRGFDKLDPPMRITPRPMIMLTWYWENVQQESYLRLITVTYGLNPEFICQRTLSCHLQLLVSVTN